MNMLEYFSSNEVVDEMIRLSFADVKPENSYRNNLLNSLINAQLVLSDEMAKPKGKVVFAFSFAAVVVAGLIVYGLWLPTVLDFLTMA